MHVNYGDRAEKARGKVVASAGTLDYASGNGPVLGEQGAETVTAGLRRRHDNQVPAEAKGKAPHPGEARGLDEPARISVEE
jgi:hypothetical protein